MNGHATRRIVLLVVAAFLAAIPPFFVSLTRIQDNGMPPRGLHVSLEEWQGKTLNATHVASDRDTQSSTTIKPSNQVFQEYLEYLQKKTSQQATSEDILRSLPIRYYMYTNDKISQRQNLMAAQRAKMDGGEHLAEADYEHEILDALEKHPLRTGDISKADLFVIPTPVSDIFLCSHSSMYDQAFQALISHDIWNHTLGHRHVMLGLSMNVFHWKSAKKAPHLYRWHAPLYNVTIAQSYDAVAISKMSRKERASHHGYELAFSRLKPMTRSAFSIGLGMRKGFPFVPATFDNFQKKELFLFYRTRTAPSVNNSTQFRHAPLHMNLSRLDEPCSIGVDIPPTTWLQHFVSSKFCLVIRGDTPHSHALFRAIMVGCIPVIVSNALPMYSPLLRSSLNIDDYSVFIDEYKFLENPEQELVKLKDLANIEKKIQGLALAQKVMLPDHPDSLLVPAFLRETMESILRGAD